MSPFSLNPDIHAVVQAWSRAGVPVPQVSNGVAQLAGYYTLPTNPLLTLGFRSIGCSLISEVRADLQLGEIVSQGLGRIFPLPMVPLVELFFTLYQSPIDGPWSNWEACDNASDFECLISRIANPDYAPDSAYIASATLGFAESLIESSDRVDVTSSLELASKHIAVLLPKRAEDIEYQLETDIKRAVADMASLPNESRQFVCHWHEALAELDMLDKDTQADALAYAHQAFA